MTNDDPPSELVSEQRWVVTIIGFFPSTEIMFLLGSFLWL